MNNHPIEKVLTFENHPIHVFSHNGRIAFLLKEVADILQILRPSDSLTKSKALEKGIDYDIIPAIYLNDNGNFPSSSQKAQHIAILYESGFFLFVLRSNKPIAIPFTRWAIREAIPFALESKQEKAIEYSSAQILKLIELAGKDTQTGIYARSELTKAGILLPEGDKQLSYMGGGSHE